MIGLTWLVVLFGPRWCTRQNVMSKATVGILSCLVMRSLTDFLGLSVVCSGIIN